ncbi:hypothetical protein D3P08_21940 [Paenibacillus nanensis]|uniref:Uncharacterized protein n=1 Tax=Paenibacillus nanensis TaxID=393251 RepID=A0A3A1UUJ6_9BACL|nr:hypothetical protein [Paenibacillus nanensis]RIX49933.1 hypothetical protein D3P08_21940 [Paenibacillus nanensis]
MDPFILAIVIWVLTLLLLGLIIRGAIDSSNMSKKVDALAAEVRQLRKVIKENKHIIDKKV